MARRGVVVLVLMAAFGACSSANGRGLLTGVTKTGLKRCAALQHEHYPKAMVSGGNVRANGDVPCSLITYETICRDSAGIGQQRDRLGLGELSVGVSDNPPGSEVATHRHACGEVFVVYDGRGVYTIGDAEIVAVPGDVVIVPPNTWHSFRPDVGMPLRHVAAYDRGNVTIEFASGRVI